VIEGDKAAQAEKRITKSAHTTLRTPVVRREREPEILPALSISASE
jgi:hypothetical protein